MYTYGKLLEIINAQTSKRHNVSLGNLKVAAQKAGLKFFEATKANPTFDILDGQGGIVKFEGATKVSWTFNMDKERGIIVFVPRLSNVGSTNNWNLSDRLLAALGYESIHIEFEEKIVDLPVPSWAYPMTEDTSAWAGVGSLAMFASDAKAAAEEFISNLQKFL